MDNKLVQLSDHEEEATERIGTSYSRIIIDIVDLMKEIGISPDKVPQSIQEIVIKYQSIEK